MKNDCSAPCKKRGIFYYIIQLSGTFCKPPNSSGIAPYLRLFPFTGKLHRRQPEPLTRAHSVHDRTNTPNTKNAKNERRADIVCGFPEPLPTAFSPIIKRRYFPQKENGHFCPPRLCFPLVVMLFYRYIH